MHVTLQRWIPWSLIALRLMLAPVAVIIVWLECSRMVWMLQFVLAAVSDIYDGRLARRWGTATAGLRQADSVVDTFYGVGVTTTT